MKKQFLQLSPKYYICPYCGQLHTWKHNSLSRTKIYSKEVYCENLTRWDDNEYSIQCTDDYLYYSIVKPCKKVAEIEGKVPISSILEVDELSIITFPVELTTKQYVSCSNCHSCSFVEKCYFCRLGEIGDGREIKMQLGFVFDEAEYKSIMNQKQRNIEEPKPIESSKEQNICKEGQNENPKTEKERTIMAEKTKKTSIKETLYERSPKENIEKIKEFANKYKSTLRWLVPTVSVYAAYRILNSKEFDLSVNNVSDVCEKKLGFKIGFLENKKALKELMTLGGISAGAYGAMKAVSSLFANKEEDDVSVEDVEDGMDRIEAVRKKFSWLQPKLEDMLPIAFSVIVVYSVLHKPSFNGKFATKIFDLVEDAKFSIGTYVELARMFIEDKFNLNLSDEEEQRKVKICAILVALIGITIFLYGKKVIGKTDDEPKEENSNASENVAKFVEEARKIIKKIAPSVYTTLVTFLVSKKLLQLEDEDWDDLEGNVYAEKETVEAEIKETGEADAIAETVTK